MFEKLFGQGLPLHEVFPHGRCCFFFCIIAFTIVSVGIARFIYVLHKTGKPLQPRSPVPTAMSTLLVLGSGGHTAEMLNLLLFLQKDRFSPRFYVAATTDNLSLAKARSLEESFVCKNGIKSGSAKFMSIYRSREVGQSCITSIATTLVATGHACWIMLKIKPQVVFCNGPGTCVPLCAIAFLFKVVGIRWSMIFYVESAARVRKLSLSGLLLYKLGMIDKLFVQWPHLQKAYPRSHYVGCLM